MRTPGQDVLSQKDDIVLDRPSKVVQLKLYCPIIVGQCDYGRTITIGRDIQ